MQKIAIVTPALDILPYNILSWERYQIFCSDVLSQKLGVLDCREYLKQGDKQDGIDIYATLSEGNKKVVAQCKLEKYLGPQDVDNLITEFINGNKVNDVQEFILCTSYSLSKHRDENSTIKNAEQKLKEKNIRLIVWDEKGMSQYLRIHPHPSIVYHFFKEDIAKAFYGEIWEEYIDRLKRIPKKSYIQSEDHIERKVVPYIKHQNKETFYSLYDIKEDKQPNLINLFETPHLNKQGRRVILLGVAGFGKTQELNTLAAFYSTEDKPIHPIRNLLKDYEGQSIEVLLDNYHRDWRNIPSSALLLLFDALDEIKEQYYQIFINYLNAFTENNPSANTLITSRFNFYDLGHPQLREFDTYILEKLTYENIEDFIIKKLASHKTLFIQKIEQYKFSEYLINPYYLTRLIRFYTIKKDAFPKNKPELFSRILFEQLDNDEFKFNITELKEKLLPAAQKIAYCMTISGKSSLTKDELKQIIPKDETRRNLKHLCILNLNATTKECWSFEHKNLQEYLCASLFSCYSFTQIQELITFSFNRNRLLPRFLNTISFLLGIIDSANPLFTELFNWLQANQPELLVRFEKDKIGKEKRQEIFKIIYDYYKKRRITLHISSNFSISELADFAEIDHSMIDFLRQELSNPLDEEIAYDSLQLLSCCKKAYLFENNLSEIYFSILNSDIYTSFVKGQAIFSMSSLNREDKNLFQKILNTKIVVTDYEIRKRLIWFLEYTSYFEEYATFIIESISILESTQNNRNYIGGYDGITRLILKFKKASSLKIVLQYCISHKHILARYHIHDGFHLDDNQLKELFEKAISLYKEDSIFVKLIYRIFVGIEGIAHDDKILPIFQDFFQKTCGCTIIFRKFYKYDNRQREMLDFADEKCIDFIIDEYVHSRINDDMARIIRNRLSWRNDHLCKYYLEKLNSVSDNKFKIEEDNTDYQKIYETYKHKNQLILLDKNLFLEEVSMIFEAISKKEISYEDIHDYDNKKLRTYQHSIVKEKISRFCIHDGVTTTKENFIKSFSSDSSWDSLVIEEIFELLKQKKNIPLIPNLLQWAKNWLINRIKELNFKDSIRDNLDGSYTYYPDIEFVKELYQLIDIDIDDHLLLGMLESDFSGIYSENDFTGVSMKVIRQITKPDLLKSKVLENIRSHKLANPVLFTHFKVCHQMQFQECLPYLFDSIISNPLFKDYEKRRLTEYYLELGGDISDFSNFLVQPVFNREEDCLISWQWFLIEKFIVIDPDRVADILMLVNKDPLQGNQAKIKVILLLLQAGRKEGLNLWADYIYTNHKLPFEHEIKEVQHFIETNADDKTIEILVQTLDYSFEHKIFTLRSFDSIQEFIFRLLLFLVLKNSDKYSIIKEAYEKLLAKYSAESFVQQIVIFIERFNQRFYENHEYEINITDSLISYNRLNNQ